MKPISRLTAIISVILIHSSVSFAETAKFSFFQDFGLNLALTLPDRKVQVFRDFKITWNRKFRTVDIQLWDFYRGEMLLLWVKPNNAVFWDGHGSYYGKPGLFEELKARATSQTSHYVGCDRQFRY